MARHGQGKIYTTLLRKNLFYITDGRDGGRDWTGRERENKVGLRCNYIFDGIMWTGLWPLDIRWAN